MGDWCSFYAARMLAPACRTAALKENACCSTTAAAAPPCCAPTHARTRLSLWRINLAGGVAK